jgi:hypothetical protein
LDAHERVPNGVAVDLWLTCSNLCMYLRFGRRLIVKALKSDSLLAKIAIPSNEDILSYQEAVGTIYPLLSNVWFTMDGLKLYLAVGKH